MGLLSIECGLITLGIVIRYYHLVNYGPSSKSSLPLTAEQIEPIRRALEDDDWRTAHERYREAMPKAGWAERFQYLTDLKESSWAKTLIICAAPVVACHAAEGNADRHHVAGFLSGLHLLVLHEANI